MEYWKEKRNWNDGMLEYWEKRKDRKKGEKRNGFCFSLPIVPLFQYSSLPVFDHYSIIPVFQLPIIPVFQYSSIPVFYHLFQPFLSGKEC